MLAEPRELAPDADLAEVAERVKAAHLAYEAQGPTKIARAIEAGELLAAAKKRLAHGQWIPWLRNACKISQPTASRYMQVAARRSEIEANHSRMNDLSLNAVLKMLTKDRHAAGGINLLGEEADAPAPLHLPLEAKSCTDLRTLIDAGERFGTIYADPPWAYGNQATRASTDNHYPTMTVEEIAALPVAGLAADDAHLHLWTTNGFLFESKAILDAWGFEFRSTFVWCKPQMGIGNYWRNSHEILLTAVRGDAKRFNDRSLKSWEVFDRGAHSAKPEKVRGFIERASPGPRLEMFGRRLADGWTVWGNQIERTMFDGNVKVS